MLGGCKFCVLDDVNHNGGGPGKPDMELVQVVREKMEAEDPLVQD